MSSEAFIQLALCSLRCTQRELAQMLGVSPTQISKWKTGDNMSREEEVKLRGILGIGEQAPELILAAGSRDAAKKWESLIRTIADFVKSGAETGYDVYPLDDDLGGLAAETSEVLQRMGISFPEGFPSQFEVNVAEDNDQKADDEGRDDEDGDYADHERGGRFWDEVKANEFTNTISKIFMSLNDVYGFYAAYIEDLLFDDNLNLSGTEAENIENCLMALAACKTDVDEKYAPKIQDFRREVINDYEDWIALVKERAFRAGVPLKAELMDIVHGDHNLLGHKAEAESLGLNKSRLHPDIYMNELLVGMRLVHQVLPAIMKKLGIANEFRIDSSDLRVK
ncbi:helix-turn-helix domain-containing protein [Caballeronia grimmiae]|uniref:helix-turn-helix domain-containing protein n=1 Tax=Caballeronia grimmiae TaxID=1071679 RepID=UPI0038BB8A63